MKSNQLENLTRVQKVNDLLFDLYLEKEALYKFHVIEFFAPYDPRKNLTCITT